MTQRIIYPNGDGVSVLIPSGDLPIGEVARKDVPIGVPFRIVATADIPSDRSQRDLWTADFSTPDGHGIGAAAWFAEKEVIIAAAHAEELGSEDTK